MGEGLSYRWGWLLIGLVIGSASQRTVSSGLPRYTCGDKMICSGASSLVALVKQICKVVRSRRDGTHQQKDR